ncbi:hypothetical protein RRG08_054640 [Elysia crispata]|uniref:Uncharacterized protein n=1 Tax=Elysia crispata TaxID=231223 RepID=A0AAE1B1I6_9GAST|nr:hypothetical protein RRG08_054640 [Elysia crispata]
MRSFALVLALLPIFVDWKALCTNHYRNDDALDNWTNIREVLYGLVDNGILVKVLRFKGAGSNYLNWMSKNRLIESDWEDLKFAKPNFFGLVENLNEADVSPPSLRYPSPSSTTTEAVWTVTVDKEKPACIWERNETYPYFKYVAGQKYENLNSYRIRSAQAIVVLLNYMHFPQGEPSEYHDLFRTGEKECRFAFRGTAKVGQLVYQAYETGAEVKDYMEATCKTDNWKNIDQILFGIIHKGKMVKTNFFNGERTNYLDWFQPEYLLNSSWYDLPIGSQHFFSIIGNPDLKRRFYIERNFGACTDDAGWVVVSNKPPRPCPWEDSEIFPIIKFTAGPKAENWSEGDVLEADAFVIFLKYKKL